MFSPFYRSAKQLISIIKYSAVFLLLAWLAGCSAAKKARSYPPVTDDSAALHAIRLVPNLIHVGNDSFYLNLPGGYHINVAYEGLHRLRFMTRSPDGRLFATDMYDLEDNKRSKVYIFEGWDAITHRFKTVRTYLQRLRNVTQVAFYHTEGKDFIYVPETGRLTRYEYHAGDNAPRGKGQILATFPAYGLSYKYGGWHLTRSLAFHNNKMYVSVGSSCNACVEKEPVRATVMEMDPDGHHPVVFASGLRNSVGIKWIGDELWATGMGQDKLGLDKPEDIFTNVKRDGYYGWPYYYHYQRNVYADEVFQDSVRRNGVTFPVTAEKVFCGFKAHSAPLGFDHFTGFSDPLLKDHFIVALHGSTDVSLQRGNAVVMIDRNGNYTHIIDGFLVGNTMAGRKGRPCDVMMNDDHSFFITDDMRGVLYYVWKE